MQALRTKRARLFLALGTLVALAVVLAAWRANAGPTVPQGIAYSGELYGNGTPENATHSMTFTLFEGANPLCSDGPRSVSVASGRFDVANLFASGCTLDLHLATKTGLQLQVTVDGVVLMPMQPLGAVPFAARSRVAETAESFSGALVGDVTGPQTQTSVQSLRGVTVANTAPTDGQVMVYNGSSKQWEPRSGYLFGGAYTMRDAGCGGGGGCYQINTLTGACSCPPGFQTVSTGSIQCMASYFCFR